MALCVSLLVTSACGSSEPGATEGAAPSIETAATGRSSGVAYPAPYRDLGLPEMPGAEVISTGRQAMSLRDGLAIQLATPMSVDDARSYYSIALADLGWVEQPSRVMTGLPMAGLQATKDDLRYTVTITSTPDGVARVSISVIGS